MKVGITGSRNNLSKEQLDKFIKFLKDNNPAEIHHGDCIGADSMCHDIAESFNIKIVIHPPDNNTMRANKKSDNIMQVEKYLKRNHNIVDTTDILVAFPPTKEEILRSGTWATIRYAKKKNKQVFIIFPE
jgi:hypothetical protein